MIYSKLIVFTENNLIQFCENVWGNGIYKIDDENKQIINILTNSKYSYDELKNKIEKEYNCKIKNYDFTEIDCDFFDEEWCYLFEIE